MKLTDNKQPTILYALCFSELCDRFAFYGTSALLILFLIHAWNFSLLKATAFYSVYIALGFSLPVLGGWIADRYLGLRLSVYYGGIGMIIGNLIIAIPLHFCIYLGLAITIFGMGLFKGNITSLVNYLYPPGDSRHKGGFTIFYMAMNLGAIIGPIVCGLTAKFYNWNFSFIVNAMILTLGLSVFYYFRHHLHLEENYRIKPHSRNSQVNIILIAILLCSLLVIALMFYFPLLGNNLVGIYSICIFAGIILVATRRTMTERKKIIGLTLLCLLSVTCNAANTQIGSSLILFIDQQLRYHVFGFVVPSSSFFALQPLFIILLSPGFASLWIYLTRKQRCPSLTNLVTLGTLLSSIAFVVFALAAEVALHNNPNFSLFLIILGNLILSLSELCIVPTISAAIAEYSPQNMSGTMMGIFYMSSAFAGYIANYMTKFNIISATKTNFILGFSKTALIIFVASILIYLISPLLNSLLKDDKLTDSINPLRSNES